MKGFIEQIYRNTKDYKGIIFLDRDGTINREVNYLRWKYQIEILPTVVRGLRLLNKKHIAVIVVTNQPAVARGLVTIKGLKELNDTLFGVLRKKDAYIDAIYSCPHHPEKGHPDIPLRAMKYRIECECRKPGLAMYKKALSIYGPKKILGVVGDRTKDALAGKKLGTRAVIVKTGYKGKPRTHDLTVGAFGNFASRFSMNPRSDERGIWVRGKDGVSGVADFVCNNFLDAVRRLF